MAQVIVDEALLREPNLLVPHKKPQGRVKVDWRHPIPSSYELLSAYLFNGEHEKLGSVNATNQPHVIYDAAQERVLDVQCDYSLYYNYAIDKNGSYVRNTYASTGNIVSMFSCDHVSDTLGHLGWSRTVDYSSYTILILAGTDPSGLPAGGISSYLISDESQRFCQIVPITLGTSSQTIRAINDSRWTVADDESFTETIAAGDDLFFGMSYEKATGHRGLHFQNSFASRSTFTGVFNPAGSFQLNMFTGGGGNYGFSPKYVYVFARSMPAEAVWEVKRDPYQFLIPA